VLYHPEESQLLTTGSDRKITYWETFDGQAIRMIDGSDEGEVNALAVTKEGEHFISGGEDKEVKLWGYDEGICYYTGTGHSGAITRVLYTYHNQYRLLSVQTRSPSYQSELKVFNYNTIFIGSIFIWKMPSDVTGAKAENELPTISKTEKSEKPNNNKGTHIH
jgi:WD40 repeat protein